MNLGKIQKGEEKKKNILKYVFQKRKIVFKNRTTKFLFTLSIKTFVALSFLIFSKEKKVASPGCTRDTFTLLNVKRPKYNFEIGGNTYIQPGEVPKI